MNVKSLLGRLKNIEDETNDNVPTVHGYMLCIYPHTWAGKGVELVTGEGDILISE